MTEKTCSRCSGSGVVFSRMVQTDVPCQGCRESNDPVVKFNRLSWLARNPHRDEAMIKSAFDLQDALLAVTR